ncbi:hypothetical protein G9A89_010915 [Geosiphon pyriformis]|nr:hypothetical protein G9A89_010915 [Geosiphon pyriformis]
MENTLTQVVKYCGEQLEKYQLCVENHPQDWSSACIKEKHELTKCSDENVTELRDVKQKCHLTILGYDECLSKNFAEPEKCIEQLKALYHCTEAATNRKLFPNSTGPDPGKK